MATFAVVVLVAYEPPLGEVTAHVTAPNDHPLGMGVSLTVYVWKVVMFPKIFVFAEVPSSTSEKFVTGEGEPVKLKLVEPFGVASLITVSEPGKMTASAESDRSWLPPERSRSMRRV